MVAFSLSTLASELGISERETFELAVEMSNRGLVDGVSQFESKRDNYAMLTTSAIDIAEQSVIPVIASIGFKIVLAIGAIATAVAVFGPMLTGQQSSSDTQQIKELEKQPVPAETENEDGSQAP